MKIDHLGIAVNDLDSALSFYRDVMGLREEGQEEVPSQGVKVAFLKTGESNIELLEGLGDDSPISKFIVKRGEGIHHLALQVSDLDTKVEELKEKGVRFISEEPREGAHGKRIIFIHPKSTNGVLLELCELKEEGR